ncbi:MULTISPECIES: hybrid sensor histidine kinase/response regulator [unclassified Colwellia]|uniref:hybrid sensor histidine kinase/response regulator n=1 Tax=unclassified Colwellia TaxID=196834 RepID=UPI0015F4EB79|nr:MULTISPECIES: hybrid sensor histidine kinase/response regulator [unclassified Colwellia]MBA6257839.1 response regulator [Colwellia sp. MB3u-28]MBA6258480.1 response regulator [Colwellia sp. MB3u-41]
MNNIVRVFIKLILKFRFSLKCDLNLLLIASLFFTTHLYASQVLANNNNIRFQKYSLKQGLSQQAVFSILQDRQGFMWFATQEGLNRFDGYQFRVFSHEANDSNSLSHDAIYTMFEDHNGLLWLGTDGGGLNRFDPISETFEHFSKKSHNLSSDRINVIFEDKDHILWIGTDGGGLNRFDPTTEVFQSFLHDTNSKVTLNHNNVRSIHQGKQGQLWLGTDKGINIFDINTLTFTNFTLKDNISIKLHDYSIRSLFVDEQQRVWIGTYRNGLITIDQQNNVTQYKSQNEDKTSVCANTIHDIFQDNIDNIWLATDNGLCLWQPASDNFTQFRHDVKDLYSLGDNRTRTLYQDNGGVLWLGTFGGINKWSPSDFSHYRQTPNNKNSLSSNIITAFSERNNGDVWVGSYDGLNLFNPQKNTFTRFKVDESAASSLSDNRIMSLHSDADDSLWIGTRGKGLDHYNPKTNLFTHYTHNEKEITSLSANGVTDIYQDNQGVLWVATYTSGLNRFEPATKTFKHFRHDVNDDKSLSTDRILSIHQGKNNTLWLGTEGGGLNLFDPKTETVTQYLHNSKDPDSLSNNVAWSILEDPQGDLWVGTWGGGLNRWAAADRKTGKVRFKHYGKKQGLLSNVIYGIVADGQGFIWLSTNRGLTRLDPQTEQLKQYDVSHGLQENEFNHNAAMNSRHGQLFFGGSNGFNMFTPAEIKENNNQLPVLLTGLLKINKKTKFGDAVAGLNNIIFDYKDYVIAFEFAGLDYTAPEKNNYKYKLEGFDQNWIEIGKVHRTTFTNLPAGDYIFRVKGANNDGIWSEKSLALNIKVTPAPWESWWAYSLYILFVIMIFFFYIRAYKTKLHQKAEYSRHLEKQVILRTTELTTANHALEISQKAAQAGNRAKGAFISTMSHELRTPMTSILGFAESILQDPIEPEEEHRRINKIISNGNYLLQLMNNVLDISKIEVNCLDLENIAVSPVEIMQELEELIGQRATEKKLNLTINYLLPIPGVIQSDPTRLKQILLNLCGNAIKFTEKGGITINISADQQTNLLSFSVVDTGIGIPENKIASVFEEFTQVDSSTTRKFGGTGLGLSISKELTQAMGGEMHLTSQEGIGSQFSFSIGMGAVQVLQWLNEHSAIDKIKHKHNAKEYKIPTLTGNILLAEDWPDNQELIRLYVERTGAKVTLVENGQLAVEVALSNDFDMVLMDVQMPEVDGIEATKILRATGFSKPIIALTANISNNDIELYLKSGFSGHLKKPIEIQTFYQTLANILPTASIDLEPSVAKNIKQVEQQQVLINTFIEGLPTILAEIQQMAEEKNWLKLQNLLHNLKGLGGSFGFPEVSQQADILYQSLLTKKYSLIIIQLDTLQQITTKITDEINL